MGMQCFYEYFMYYASKNVIQSIAHIGSLHIFFYQQGCHSKNTTATTAGAEGILNRK